MLTRPDISDEALAAHLRVAYGLDVTSVAFLPLGADYDTALYRAETASGESFFCRLRSGPWNEVAVQLPAALHAAGVPGIVPLLRTREGGLSAPLGVSRLSVLPWVEARNGYEAPLNDAQWEALGAACAVCMRRAAGRPAGAIPVETFPDRWRLRLRAIMAELESTVPSTPGGRGMAACGVPA